MTYGPITTTVCTLRGYVSTWYDYDGAPDALDCHSMHGEGKTRAIAIKELLALTEELNESDERLTKYRDYLISRDEALMEDRNAT